jgi:hypothetical protein
MRCPNLQKRVTHTRTSDNQVQKLESSDLVSGRSTIIFTDKAAGRKGEGWKNTEEKCLLIVTQLMHAPLRKEKRRGIV